MKLYQHIAHELARYASGNSFTGEWGKNCLSVIEKQYLPSGCGFDAGCAIGGDCKKFWIVCDFHHLNDNGFYTGWSRHKVIVKPDLMYGFNARITGRNVNDIKDYIADVIYSALDSDILPAEWQELMKDCKP